MRGGVMRRHVPTVSVPPSTVFFLLLHPYCCYCVQFFYSRSVKRSEIVLPMMNSPDFNTFFFCSLKSLLSLTSKWLPYTFGRTTRVLQSNHSNAQREKKNGGKVWPVVCPYSSFLYPSNAWHSLHRKRVKIVGEKKQNNCDFIPHVSAWLDTLPLLGYFIFFRATS